LRLNTCQKKLSQTINKNAVATPIFPMPISSGSVIKNINFTVKVAANFSNNPIRIS
jgi:hypothetical protein